jgi:hypothetical protein
MFLRISAVVTRFMMGLSISMSRSDAVQGLDGGPRLAVGTG